MWHVHRLAMNLKGSTEVLRHLAHGLGKSRVQCCHLLLEHAELCLSHGLNTLSLLHCCLGVGWLLKRIWKGTSWQAIVGLRLRLSHLRGLLRTEVG